MTDKQDLSRDEALTLLSYMVHHNEHHAEELQEAAEALTENEAKHVREAIALLTASSNCLRLVLKNTEEE